MEIVMIQWPRLDVSILVSESKFMKIVGKETGNDVFVEEIGNKAREEVEVQRKGSEGAKIVEWLV